MNRTLQDDLDSYFDEVEVRGIEIGLGEKLARGRHANFDEVIAPVFREMAEDGELRRQLLSQTDIASALYEYGTKCSYANHEDRHLEVGL